MTNQSEKRIKFFDLVAQHALLRKELSLAFAEVLESAQFVGSDTVAPFEADFASFAGCSQAVAVSSGTDALRFALLALDLAPGSRVVTVPNTFIATAEAISQAGCLVDFVDVDPKTCLMDPNRLEDLLRTRFATPRDRPAAVVAVHLYGQCAEMEAIRGLAQRYELRLVEDAAQAHGAQHHGRPAGSLADIAAFSFYPGKNLGACGEAGAVTTNDDVLAERVRKLRDHGRASKYVHVCEGYNGRMDALQAKILRIKLGQLKTWNSHRCNIAALYDAALAQTSVSPVLVHRHNLSAYHLYVVRSPYRDDLRTFLDAAGIETGVHYPVPLHLQPCYAHRGIPRGSFPHAERAAAEVLSLPMYAELPLSDAHRVTHELARFEQWAFGTDGGGGSLKSSVSRAA